MPSTYAPYTLAMPHPSDAWRAKRDYDAAQAAIADLTQERAEWAQLMADANAARDGQLAHEAYRVVVDLDRALGSLRVRAELALAENQRARREGR